MTQAPITIPSWPFLPVTSRISFLSDSSIYFNAAFNFHPSSRGQEGDKREREGKWTGRTLDISAIVKEQVESMEEEIKRNVMRTIFQMRNLNMGMTAQFSDVPTAHQGLFIDFTVCLRKSWSFRREDGWKRRRLGSRKPQAFSAHLLGCCGNIRQVYIIWLWFSGANHSVCCSLSLTGHERSPSVRRAPGGFLPASDYGGHIALHSQGRGKRADLGSLGLQSQHTQRPETAKSNLQHMSLQPQITSGPMTLCL